MAQATHREPRQEGTKHSGKTPRMQPRIVSATVPRHGIVALTFSDGAHGEVDFRPDIRKGGVFAKLASPEVFKKVRIAFRGGALAWSRDLDVGADSLWLEVTGRWEPGDE